ncbi:low molecular weight phosphotyrosine protein phosphatase [Buttiauxella sp. 3AFRM03]|uniref:low molecular weight protein-tyrosine-phosphatase n=1 Tax=Buttiauxella sp. 3AFRM03 TaxID=2479367 RepID=UPI000EF827DC|nr:low molecular weight protein-tyrosine-phosphatase [Buttiauxella sp. 3AFRM03]AYN27977.1 low molecular weight phosphotyrosine protein phosphatase [Buttiauxella sp. 3AFRM03]
MITSILVICTGNLCRSPVAERLLAQLLPRITVHSAGLNASKGMLADSVMIELAEEKGIVLTDHRSKRFTPEKGLEYDLILVMETKQAEVINHQYPQLSGKCHLLTHWNGRADIPDPYRKSHELYRMTFQRMMDATTAWKKVLLF